MTKIRTFWLCALAVILVFGVGGQQALRAQDAVNPHIHMARLASGSAVHAASTVVLPGILSIGFPLADSGGADTWPCFTGFGADCTSIPAGGLVVAVPSVGDVSSACSACAQIYWTFETNGTGPGAVAVAVKQGSTTVYSLQGGIGTITPGVWVVWVDGVTFTGAVPGAATINVLDVVGSGKAKASASIYLQ
ncbi:MAG TPA: hypothetical protein VMI94_18620 [Bryobacteraceae bacterium]|nr:hypothetical protein [Bryobacteraceae bacterium]